MCQATDKSGSGLENAKSGSKWVDFCAELWFTLSANKIMEKLGDCTNEDLVEEIFGSVSEFACQVERLGNNFDFGNFRVTYDESKDIHYFWA